MELDGQGAAQGLAEGLSNSVKGLCEIMAPSTHND